MIHSDLAAFNHINEPSRRRYQDVTATSQVLHLSANVSAAVDDASTHVRSVRKLHTHTGPSSTVRSSNNDIHQYSTVWHA